MHKDLEAAFNKVVEILKKISAAKAAGTMGRSAEGQKIFIRIMILFFW